MHTHTYILHYIIFIIIIINPRRACTAGVTPSARMCQGVTAVVEGRQLVYLWFYMYIQKSIEQRFPGVSVLLEVKAWALYCISVMRWNPAEPRRRCRSRVSIMFYLVHAHTGACIHRQATKTLSRNPHETIATSASTGSRSLHTLSSVTLVGRAGWASGSEPT